MNTQKPFCSKNITQEKLKESFENFYKQTGHYPTVWDIDNSVGDLEFPITSRTIMRNFGGLKKFRELIGLKIINYTAGTERAAKTIDSGNTALQNENELYNFLIEKFGFHYIHEQARLRRDRKLQSDFLVYHRDGRFFVDVFYPTYFESMVGCINIKFKKYKNTDVETIFVQANDSIGQDQINLALSRRIVPLPANIKVMTIDNFEKYCNRLDSINSAS